MSTPTDPYSRPDHEDGHDDILEPLPGQRDERAADEADPAVKAHRHDAESVGAPVNEPAEGEQTHADKPADSHLAREESRPAVDSETESTQAWKPDFTDGQTDNDGATRATERERWEAAFSSPTTNNEPTVVNEPASSDETLVAKPAPPAVAAGDAAYPTRTSVFNRGDADTAGGPHGSTPPEAAQPAPAAHPQFDHRYEQPIPEEPRGRGWAHAGVFFATLILAPLAWYLVADSGVRLAGLEDSAWNTGTADWLVVLELLGALLCLGVLWYLASFSSVGAIVFGTIIAIAGAIAIFAPTFAQDLLQSSTMQEFAGLNDFTGNVHHHLTNDMASGRLTIYGFLLLMTGVVSHAARRHGAERGDIIGRRTVLLSRKSDA